MRRQLRKGENVSDAKKRWKSESLHQKIRKKEQQKKEELKELESKNIKRQKVIAKLPTIVIPSPMDYVPGNKKLSILICSIKSRKKKLENLLDLLRKQTNDDVEILVEIDDRKITIGEKRNILLGRAKGDYIAFVDDDDMISADYVSKILESISHNPDCCSLVGKITFQKRKISKTFIHSIKYNKWFEEKGVYYRCPNHLNTVKRELALQIMFPEISVGEDHDYSTRLYPLLKIEEIIEGVIYYYLTG